MYNLLYQCPPRRRRIEREACMEKQVRRGRRRQCHRPPGARCRRAVPGRGRRTLSPLPSELLTAPRSMQHGGAARPGHSTQFNGSRYRATHSPFQAPVPGGTGAGSLWLFFVPARGALLVRAQAARRSGYDSGPGFVQCHPVAAFSLNLEFAIGSLQTHSPRGYLPEVAPDYNTLERLPQSRARRLLGARRLSGFVARHLSGYIDPFARGSHVPDKHAARSTNDEV